jgi:hypothetical protein
MNVRYQVSHPYNRAGVFVVLYNVMFGLLGCGVEVEFSALDGNCIYVERIYKQQYSK